MPVLSIDDFKQYFVNSNRYGDKRPEWPRETLVVYKCEWDIECDGHCNKGKLPWAVIRNEEDTHAEMYLLNSLRQKLKTYNSFRYENFENQQDEFKKNLHKVNPFTRPVGYFFLEIYLTYSPCGNCSDQLISFATEFHKELDVSVNIRFSTFYNHRDPTNWVGLLRLRNFQADRIPLYIFNGPESWDKFFEDMEVKGSTTVTKWKRIATNRERQDREADDDRIFSMLDGPNQVPKGRCFKFFNDYDIHPPCGWSHQCLWCGNIHDIPHLCN